MQGFLILLKSTFKLALRKKLVLSSMIIFPVISTFLVFLSDDVSKTGLAMTRLLVHTEVKNVYSDAILASLRNSGNFEVIDLERDESLSLQAQFERIADRTAINIFVQIPKDIESRLKSEGSSALIIYHTGNDDRVAFLKGFLQPVLTRLKTFSAQSGSSSKDLERLLQIAGQESLRGETKSFIESSNPRSGEKGTGKFRLVIGFFSWFAIWGSSYVIVMILRERELKVFKRIMLTNTGIMRYISSKLLVGIVIGIIQVALMLVSFEYIVKADYIIKLWQLGILLFGFILIAITINLALVSFFANENQISIISIAVVNITAMLSGSYWPIEIMPESMIKVSYLMPQRWIMHTINQLAAGYSFALFEYTLVTLGFIIFFTSISLIGFNYRARLDV